MVSGTEGYSSEAKALIKRYEKIPFAEKHKHVLHLFPSEPGYILDIGAGTGADAAWFADRGHRVVAVEPTDELRLPGMALHPSSNIEWVRDSLPGLAVTLKRQQKFDLVTITGVWMHLDEPERHQAMPNVASLLQNGAALVISLRHGHCPPGRRMFDVSVDETKQLAQANQLRCIFSIRSQSIQSANCKAGVMWSHLAFVR